MAPEHGSRPWLSERLRVGLSSLIAVVASVIGLWLVDAEHISVSDAVVIVMLAYLLTYLLTTLITFSKASRDEILTWAERERRGTFLERYVLGSAPGPGVSLFFAMAALWVAVIWLPGLLDSAFGVYPRLVLALATVAAAWSSVVTSFAVTFYADNVMEDEKGLDIANTERPQWSDYIYFALSVMATFGTTDVTVNSAEMRRTVSVNAVIAFVFNTFVVAALVSALNAATT